MDLVDIDKVLDILEQSVEEDANRTKALQQNAVNHYVQLPANGKFDGRAGAHDVVDSIVSTKASIAIPLPLTNASNATEHKQQQNSDTQNTEIHIAAHSSDGAAQSATQSVDNKLSVLECSESAAAGERNVDEINTDNTSAMSNHTQAAEHRAENLKTSDTKRNGAINNETEVVTNITEQFSTISVAPVNSNASTSVTVEPTQTQPCEENKRNESLSNSHRDHDNQENTRNAATASNIGMEIENANEMQKIDRPLSFGFGMEDISDSELNEMLEEMERNEEFQRVLQNPNSEPQETVSTVSTDSTATVGTTEDELSQKAVECSGQLTADSITQLDEVSPQPTAINDATTSTTTTSSSCESSSPSSDCENLRNTTSNGDVQTNDLDAVETDMPTTKTATTTTLDTTVDRTVAERPQRPTTLDLKNVKSQQQQTPYEDENADTSQDDLAVAYRNSRVTLSNVQNNNTPIAHNVLDENAAEHAPENESNVTNDVEAAAAAASVVNAVEEKGYAVEAFSKENIGKVPPVWVPDYMTSACMQCPTRFTMIKRRHHCRACGQVLCSTCCSQKFKLNFIPLSIESRVCVQCYLLLTQRKSEAELTGNLTARMAVDLDGAAASAGSPNEPTAPTTTNASMAATAAAAVRSPNPNNPMEYCSTIPPHKQVDTTPVQPPTVIVPIGVLKKDGGSNSSSGSSAQMRKRKSVMFSDGIAPGSELASIEQEWNEPKEARRGPKARNQQGVGVPIDTKPPTPARDLTINARELSAMGKMGLVAQLFRNSVATAAGSSSAGAGVSANDGAANSDSRMTAAHSNDVATKHKGEIAIKPRAKRLPPNGCDEHGCFIPPDNEHGTLLPPTIERKDESNCDFVYKEVANNNELIERLRHETLQFAITSNFHVFVKVVHLKCCMNRTVINFTTHGMHHVGNDEIIILLEYKPEVDNEPPLSADIFTHLYDIYRDAEMGRPIVELSYTSPRQSAFLGSREYGGFIYIRTTFQCLQEIIVPDSPYLIGILIHRYEVPWAKIFPLRLMLRLGAQYRYYPCPHISIRHRESVYAEIAQTIINFLADFRNYTYTLPFIRGMLIHMEKRQTTVLIPRNRQEEVIKAINNSSDHILAFGGNFSKLADGHLVCIQNVNDDSSELYAYSTQAINLQGHTRKVTGANFLVLNEALKSTSGLSGKCSLVEDGLMVQILPAKMEEVRVALRNQQDIDIVCGPLNAEEQQTEIVKFKWIANDRDFNVGVKSPIDGQSLEGVYNIRVHASFNYSNTNYSIRLTDIYIIKCEEWYNCGVKSYANANTSVNITGLAEQLGRSVSMALVPFLDLLVGNGNCKLGLRATLHPDSVSYEAGSRGTKLPPLYMNALDNHLIATLHNESNNVEGEPIVMELIFYILNV